MTAAERSYLGFAIQSAKGTPISTHSAFKYILWNNAAFGPQNVTLPLDQEAGGGAMLRDVVKVGVMSGGQVELIPRPNTLGLFLLGALGKVETTDNADGSYDHVFTMPADQFDAPYFTVRSAPGNLLGEQLQDVRLNALSLNFRGANFVRGAIGAMGGLPTPVATTSWDVSTYIDGGPPLISPVSTIQLPTATSVSVLSGSFTAGMAIPMDEQWKVGSYSPDAFDINQRAFAITFNIKISDATLYSKMMYDPAGGSAWAADMFREADFLLKLQSETEIATDVPYSLTIEGNGSSGADANVVWSCTPLGMRAGRQIILSATGVFLADSATDPITVTLVNDEDSYGYVVS